MRSLAALVLCFGVLAFFSGCGPSASKPAADAGGGEAHEHEHADPKTFAEGMAQLKEHSETIAKAFVKDAPESAHEAAHHSLHDVGHALEALEKFGKDLKLADDEKAKVMEAIKSLFDNYGKIDGAMHDGTAVKYDDMKDAIQKALDTLSAVKS